MNKINEIKQRLLAITEGKWITNDLPYKKDGEAPTITTENGTYIAQTTYDMQNDTQEHNVEADTIFIAHAKEDIEYLLRLLDK